MKIPSETMKEKIIHSAIVCFYKYGFVETTFQQIATNAKITQPHIYNYFKNKMDLMLACAAYSSQKGRSFIDTAIDERRPAQERLNQYIEANINWFLQERAYGFCIISIYYFANTHENIRDIFSLLIDSSIKRIETLIYQIQNEEKVNIPNINSVSRLIHDMMVGEIFKLCLVPKKKVKGLSSHNELISLIQKLLVP